MRISDQELLAIPRVGPQIVLALRTAFGDGLAIEGAQEAPGRTRPCLVLDIETRPDDRLWGDPSFLESLRERIEPPKNYRDPLKIESYVDDELARRKARAALSPLFGRVVAIGFGLLDDDDEPEVFCSNDEELVLADFAGRLGQIGRVVLGGFNVREFDIPFLIARCAARSVEFPHWFPARRDWRGIADVRDLCTDGSLADWLRACDLPAKSGSGAESLDLRLDELEVYCRNDVAVERLLLRRLRNRFEALRPREVANR
jgi:hypothetical protein